MVNITFAKGMLMRGTILKRAKASWTSIVDVGRDSDGRRNQRWITVKGTRKEAERRLAEILNKVNNGLYIKPSQDTLGDFMGTWLVDHISTRVRPTTLDGYRWRAKSIIDVLGHLRLCDLQPHHIQAYHRAKLDEGLSSAMLVKHHNLHAFGANREPTDLRVIRLKTTKECPRS